MLSTESIKNKEVINVCDGRSLGFVSDIEVNLQEGTIEGIVLPGERGLFQLFGKGGGEYMIKWCDIKTIGEDVILVETPEGAF